MGVGAGSGASFGVIGTAGDGLAGLGVCAGRDTPGRANGRQRQGIGFP